MGSIALNQAGATFTKVAFISGAAGGIGKAISLRLARDGFNIALSDRKSAENAIEEVAKAVRELGREALVVPVDVTVQKEVDEAVMVANAGMVQVKPLTELTSEEWTREVNVNLTGVFHQYAAAARQMIKQGKGGKILGTASMAAHRGIPLMSGYSASKFGVRGLTQSAARELAKYGIIVNAYCPGYVDTNMWGSMDSLFQKYYGGAPGENRKKFESEVALGRPSYPEDVAKFVSYLASNESDYMTAVINNPIGTLRALFEICWRLPLRVLLACVKKSTPYYDPTPTTSIWLAMATAVFAPLLAHNWHLLLARPRNIDPRTAILFPPDVAATETQKDRKHGFHGFLYTSQMSPVFGKSTLKGADAVWLHAHGGGFYAGEARQYHDTYLRWVNKAYEEMSLDLRILAVEYPLSTTKPYPGALEAMCAAYLYLIKDGLQPSQIIIAGDSAGGNLAITTCYELIQRGHPSPSGLIMFSPWLDLTRSTSGNSPNQPTDWLTTFDSEECRIGAIEMYMGTTIKTAADPRVSPLWRDPIPDLPKQFLSAGRAEVLFADSEKWAKAVKKRLGDEAIECYFAPGQVHTFAIGGWLADAGVVGLSDWRVLSFVREQTRLPGH
ncbi:hypothetical protein CLAIMM_01810 [Cladophialophora immunda]|nr:hypothetical protein CLAIMM_01810 [Cladophialophora immunda]